VSLNANSTRTTGADGRAIWFPIAVGTYSVVANAAGYSTNTTNTPPIGTNQTVDVALCLNPLPCTLNVLNVLASNSAPLDGVSVNLGSALLGTKVTTGGNGLVSWSIPAGAGVTVAFGSITGYFPEQQSFTCSLGGTANITLRYRPVPNIIRVFVRDIRDDSPITTAFVSLTVTNFSTQAVDSPTARTIFTPVAAGTYTAFASAAGYFGNNTVAGPVTLNQTLDVYIYLREIPCTLVVQVLSNNTRLPIPQPDISLSTTPNRATVGDVNGRASFNFTTGDLNGVTTVFASKVGGSPTYSPGSQTFECPRGTIQNVTILLPEVLVITLAAVDASATAAAKPLLPFANIFWNDVEVTIRPSLNSPFRLKYVDSLPVTATIKGAAGGFNNKTSDPITFTLTNREFNISLAPQQFTVYFIPAELLSNGSVSRVTRDGSIPNNFLTQNPVPAGESVAYTLKSLTAGGSASQVSDPPTSQSFVANVQVTFTNTSIPSFFAFAAVFTDQVPTNLSANSAFFVQAKDLDTLKYNTPGNVSELLVPIPDFAATTERTIVFELPYKLNAAYFNIRVSPLTVGLATRNFGATDFCFARVTLRRAVRYTNYDAVDVGSRTRAIFESSITFGDAVTAIEIGFPVESYNTTLSNWADAEASSFPNLRPYATGTAPASLSAFSWPPTSLRAPLFSTIDATKQEARNPNAKLYHLQDYVLIATTRTTKKASN